MSSARKTSKPETPAQAAAWERTKARYTELGLCDRCAAQAAWGHQRGAGGWSAIKPPCRLCVTAVAELPLETANPLWKKAPAGSMGLGDALHRSTAQLAVTNGGVAEAAGSGEPNVY